ncbi:immunoglobulin-like and fibronectin type III domain-containing protein 1 [Brachyistius frenatus]|uniref:immunoglobulin-like and fibronectin type III domain-containing protein 1 n=1 Tax=Brachyistius frenatus TaxID=100188 RepID=UPI0037E73019
MWKRAKSTGSTVRQSFSLVHQYIQHFNEVSGDKSGLIRRRSKTPGVMITQYVVDVPEGKSTPDFQSRPMSVTIKEGKLAVFKAVVTGDPKPDVSWRRTKGPISDKEKFKTKYDDSTGEHILEVHKVSEAETDTYKCYAVNEYGKAACTVTLGLIDVPTNPADFRKLLRKSKVEKADGETDERFWEAMLSADRSDYERICSEFSVTDLQSILNKLQQKKKEIAQNKSKQDDVITNGEDPTRKNGLKSFGHTQDFGIKGTERYHGDVEQLNFHITGLNPADAEKFNLLLTGLNPADAEKLNLLLTGLNPADAEKLNLLLTGLNPADAEKLNLYITRLIQADPEELSLLFSGLNPADAEKLNLLISGLNQRDAEKLNLLLTGLNQADAEKLNLLLTGLNQADAEKLNLLLTGLNQVDAEKLNLLLTGLNQADAEKLNLLLTGLNQGDAEKLKLFSGLNPADAEKLNLLISGLNPADAEKLNLLISGLNPEDAEKLNLLISGLNPADAEKLNLLISGLNPEDAEKLNLLISGLNPADAEKLNLLISGLNPADAEKLNLLISGLNQADAEKLNLLISGLNQADAEKLNLLISGLNEADAEKLNLLISGLNQADAEELNLLFTRLKYVILVAVLDTQTNEIFILFSASNVDFVIKIEEIKATEREDALFECVLTDPVPTITWMGKGNVLEDGEKYSMTVSDNKLIHRLLIKDCSEEEKGIYSAAAGNASCSAWLVVEDDSDPASGGEKARKNTVAGGSTLNLEKVAMEQQIKNQEEMEKILAALKAKQEAGQRKEEMALTSNEGDSKITEVSGQGKNDEAVKDKPDAAKATKGKRKCKNSKGDGTVSTEVSGCGTKAGVQLSTDEPKNKKHIKCGRVDLDKVTDGSDREVFKDNEDLNGPEMDSGYVEQDQESENSESESSEGIDQDQIQMFTMRQREVAESNGDKTSTGHRKKRKKDKKMKVHWKQHKSEHGKCEETEDVSDSSKHARHKRQLPLIEDVVIDPGIQFICGLTDVNAIINETAELTCKLSSEDCEGTWFRDGKKISPDDNFSIIKDGSVHKLVIIKCEEEYSGKYRFEADGRKTEALIHVKDPPRFDLEDLAAFTEPVTVKVAHSAIFKMQFVGHKPIKIQWYKEGEELQDDTNTKIEKSASHSRLLLIRCQRKDTGEIKIKLKNEHGFTEAVSRLVVLGKPTSPLGPAEVTESSASCVEFKWRPPKDDGGSPVIKYTIERQQVGRNTWKKIGEIPGVPSYRDTNVDRGRKYCYRIRAVTAQGTSEVMETDDMQAGTLAFPGTPAPPKVVSAFDDCINLEWASPSNTGGSRILGYILEKRKKGSNLWTVVNAMDEPLKEKKYAVKDVVAGIEYEFRVTAINISGVGEFSNPSEFVFARDPKKPPGKVMGLKVTETSYTHLNLTWTKPEEKQDEQDEAKGYFVEIRQADCLEWSRCNSTPIIITFYSVKGLKSMDMYWVRVIATNDGGESAPAELANYVLAMPLPVRPKFTNKKMKSFIVVRAGNSVRITVNFEASPRPDIMWLKDNVPVTKRVTISNYDGSSQMLIPSSERSDSGIYSILVKNLVGQETFSTEVRVTDDPKPPGPVELEENVPDAVTVIWEPSPDEKRDDRLHYTVSILDSTKRMWATVADRLFNNKFTVCNIMQGREYNFRVYAKNDMGVSAPSESPTWGMEKKKEKFIVSVPTMKDCDLRCAPTFLVPLKLHTAPKGYECYMSCAVKGNPKPCITWYRNHISLNTNANYYISNTCGVCSMLILCVGPKDMGEYTITAENSLGRAECSTVLSVSE